MRAFRKTVCLGAACSLTSLTAVTPLAALEVIFDSDRTRPLIVEGVQPPPSRMPSRPPAYDPGWLFPVHSAALTVGLSVPLEAWALERVRRLSRPLFLVGTDTASLDWLATHRETLRRFGALGFVVEAETLAAFNTVVAAAGPGLVLVPSSGDALAGVLGLTHYPVLITREGLAR